MVARKACARNDQILEFGHLLMDDNYVGCPWPLGDAPVSKCDRTQDTNLPIAQTPTSSKASFLLSLVLSSGSLAQSAMPSKEFLSLNLEHLSLGTLLFSMHNSMHVRITPDTKAVAIWY